MDGQSGPALRDILVRQTDWPTLPSFTMISVRLLCGLLLLGLSGCYSLSPIDVEKTMRPRDGDATSYLVGVVGVWPEANYSLHEQSILIRPKGGAGLATATLRNNLSLRTPRDIRDGGRGIGSLFVMPLKSGHYELYNVLLQRGAHSFWKREDFSIPLELEAGKAYYIGDFRAACARARGTCAFIHSYQLERDQALTSLKHPQLPPLQQLPLRHFESAYPVLLDDQDSNASVLKSVLSGRLR